MSNDGVFASLPQNHFGAILLDPPWSFTVWSKDTGSARSPEAHYRTMSMDDLAALPISTLAARDCALFCWVCWPSLPQALRVIEAWGFDYKTCAFDWMKARTDQIEMFRDDGDVQIGMGYWTRANTEPCLLATRGKPRRLHADVRQGIIEPRRQHSRKPDCVHSRIERLVAGPYLELFARAPRNGWTVWGNETSKFGAAA
ncbi:adenine methyltransferase [Erythrobacteraceae bacterium CFH 75059]|uniref:MT-A70 family methyltransferase n=1 Tax=Qipengyuania thermophila TaxID=2509361 RepID=UPI00101F79A2|nr:MT-A70 family methyltransferase [Qipengyuania thermophila]TCD00718.1 adenine methyltransferase [Erythrobacteraceae bacterium CFH 75059]